MQVILIVFRMQYFREMRNEGSVKRKDLIEIQILTSDINDIIEMKLAFFLSSSLRPHHVNFRVFILRRELYILLYRHND